MSSTNVIKDKMYILLQKIYRTDLRVFFILLFGTAYAIYLTKQYLDLFFESQFLHIPFLQDLAQGKFTAEGFFTVFGEHLFPGYNLILAINYLAFGIWGGFDSIVYFLALIMSTFIFTKVIRKITTLSDKEYKIAIIFSVLTLLSTTNNPQWGMALAAAIGVSIALLCFYKLSIFLNEPQTKGSIFICALIPIAIIFFLGGYAIGFIGGILTVIFFSIFYNKKNLVKSKYIILTVIVSVLVYSAIVIYYGSLTANRPTGASFDFVSSAKFFILMVGGSLLGRATFEAFQSLIPYYICGATMTYWTIVAAFQCIRRPSIESFFFISTLIYSITTILAVSLFRYKNGLEGGMGQWYNAHTHFIAPIVFIFLIQSLRHKENKIFKYLKYASIILLITAAIIGYFCDMRKAPYTQQWKQQFADQATIILTSPESIQDKHNSFNTMLWNYDKTKKGIDFLYENSLWIFKGSETKLSGIASDKWITADTEASILCPSGSQYISFDAWRPDDWEKSKINIKTSIDSIFLEIKNQKITVKVNEKVPLLKINAATDSFPVSSETDSRKLVFIISNISCDTLSLSPPVNASRSMHINDWGPKEAESGVNPNPQPDGGIGIWIKYHEGSQVIDSRVYEIYIGEIVGNNMAIQNDLITASFDSSVIEGKGTHSVYLKKLDTSEKITIGTFTVQ